MSNQTDRNETLRRIKARNAKRANLATTRPDAREMVASLAAAALASSKRPEGR